ncbi:MAG: LptM family lipoprotein [Arenimonas sp.]
MKRLLSAAIAMTALFGLSACSAKANEHLVDVQIRDMDRYTALENYYERNQTYVAGRPGHRYSVVLQNQTGERVLAVLSIDGVNAISGQTASASQTGYVLAPYQRMEIKGWRKSMQDVAQFRFTDLPDSYAARTGRPENVGVIGVAVFRERRYQHYYEYEEEYSYRDRDDRYAPKAAERNQAGAASDSAAAPAMKSQRSVAAETQSRQELGTGHGERRYDPARQTTFERATTYPNQVSRIFYDSYESLVDRGIIRDYRYRNRDRGPDAFPIGFVPDPYDN